MIFHETLRQLRLERKLKQNQVAAILGIDRTTYTKYETGKSEPDLAMTQKLADFYNVSVDFLLGREKAPSLPEPLKVPEVELSDEDKRKINEESKRLKSLLLSSIEVAYGEEGGESTLEKILLALDEGTALAREEAIEKYRKGK